MRGKTDINKFFEKEVVDLIKKLYSLPPELKKEQKRALRKAAKPVQTEARKRVPRADRTVKRYRSAKLLKSLRAPRGKGNVVAVYKPGNLERSIKVMSFRRSKRIFIGYRLYKRSPSGEFGTERRVDGWYAHLIERGAPRQGISATPIMGPAARAASAEVGKIAEEEYKKILKKWLAKNRK